MYRNELYYNLSVSLICRICVDLVVYKLKVLYTVYFREVPVCETSVAIVISSPHRKESLDAVQYGIDTLKANVPIWKKVILSQRVEQY